MYQLCPLWGREIEVEIGVQNRLAYIGLRGVSYGPVVGHLNAHLSILREIGVITDEREGLVLELDDENALKLSGDHAHSLVAKVGVILLECRGGQHSHQADKDSKCSLHC